ncbi:MAG: ABC transporter substrate-binding protein [Desulfobacteraceae bacterium]
MILRLLGRNSIWLVLFAFFFISCSTKTESTSSSEEKRNTEKETAEQVVIRLPGGDWGYPTPYAHYPRGPGGFKMTLIFDSLLERSDEGLIPWLAEEYEVSPDGKYYLFTIRKGVTWQDGTPLTAEDVRFSLDYANRHPMVWSEIFDQLKAVELENDNQVRVTIKNPSAAMLYNLGISRIIPKHIWENVDRPKEFTDKKAAIGSGPYRLTSYSKEHGTYRFEAFKDFWGPKQRVTAIEYVPVSEEILAYEKGEIDLVRITPDLLPRFKSDDSHAIRKSPAFWGYRMIFNLENAGALKDLKVRKALAHAIDKQELVDKVARGAGVPGRAAILPPDHVMATSNVKEYSFDLKAAQTLLEQAGFGQKTGDNIRKDEKGNTLSYTLLCSSQEVRLAEVLRQRLLQAGVDLKVISKDSKSRDALVSNGEYQLAIIGHGGWGGDPDYLMQRFDPSGQGVNLAPSRSGMLVNQSPELLDLLSHQNREFDSQKRKQLVEKIQVLLADLVPEIPLFYTTEYSIYRPAKYDGWSFMFDHHSLAHGKLSYLSEIKKEAVANQSNEKAAK